MKNPELQKCELSETLKEFVTASSKELLEDSAISTPRSSFTQLCLDDRKITVKDDLSTTNGRYFFRNPTVWKSDYIPNAESPGVYLFFNKSEKAIYVGKSESTMGSRVASHVGNFGDGKFPDLAFPSAEFVITIPFIQAPFLAPAFESYLLANYSFEHNTAGQ